MLSKREQIEQTQTKGEVYYLVHWSWCSGHDEWIREKEYSDSY